MSKITPGKIHTITGRMILLDQIVAEDINIWDIVYPLSQQVRYNGQIPVAWDVLSHSTQLWLIGKSLNPSLTRDEELGILLHDAHEAYFGDIINPVKLLFREHGVNIIDNLEKLVDQAVGEAFGFDPYHMSSPLVKDLDLKAYSIESQYFGREHPEVPLFETSIPFTKVTPMDFVNKIKELARPFNPATIYTCPEELYEYVSEPLPSASSPAKRRAEILAEEEDGFRQTSVDPLKIRI